MRMGFSGSLGSGHVESLHQKDVAFPGEVRLVRHGSVGWMRRLGPEALIALRIGVQPLFTLYGVAQVSGRRQWDKVQCNRQLQQR